MLPTSETPWAATSSRSAAQDITGTTLIACAPVTLSSRAKPYRRIVIGGLNASPGLLWWARAAGLRKREPLRPEDGGVSSPHPFDAEKEGRCARTPVPSDLHQPRNR